MMRRVVVLGTICLLLFGRAWAHRIDEYLQATILSLEANRAHASMRLIPGVLVAPSVIAVVDSNHDGAFSLSETRAYANRVLDDLSITIDGQTVKPQLDSYTIPDPPQLRDGLGEISIQYHVDLLPGRGPDRKLILANHHLDFNSVYLMNVEIPQDRNLRILDQRRNERQSVYELAYQQMNTTSVPSGSWRRAWAGFKGLQFSSLFRLGMRHIAEGTDHLLFLLVLLLPAPLLAVGSRWRQAAGIRQSMAHVVGIVTAFTVGHSLTLTLAAMNFIRVPGRPVEVLIALSILVSAVHALHPLFPGKEAWIAAFFGLIHGLAFASTLDRLGLAHWDRVAGILSFNLGIETMQLLVVAAVLPSILILSRTNFYLIVRTAGALTAGLASLGWICERLFYVHTPVDSVVNAIAKQGVRGAVVLFVISLTCMTLRRQPAQRIGAAAEAKPLGQY